MVKKLKLDENGHVVVEDGKPVYVYEDGKEQAFDIDHTLTTITNLNGEARKHREGKEAAEGKLKLFEGIEDPAAALAALETTKNLSAGELKTAAQVAEIQKEAKKAADEQVRASQEASGKKINDLEKALGERTNSLYKERVGNKFAQSEFATKKVAVPLDMLQSMFESRFKTEDDGSIVGYDGNGNKIYSRANPGAVANFEEALETIVDGYAHKDTILKSSGASGSGADPRRGGGGGQTMVRGEFERLSPDRKMEVAKTHKIVD